MHAIAHSGCLLGIDAHPVQVEVQMGKGLPGFDLIGLPDRGVRESRVRVQAALRHLGFRLPPRHVVVNLAPGDLKKDGTGFDLAIAVGILAACELLRAPMLHKTLLLGELSLTGQLRPVQGALAHLLGARRSALQAAILPATQAHVGGLLPGMRVFAAEHLQEVIEHLSGQAELPCIAAAEDAPSAEHGSLADLAEVRGQPAARRALEIAAAGAHHLLMLGPPGCGKTMLAQRLPGILPPLSSDEALEVATIAGISQTAPAKAKGETLLAVRPFRAPHHSASTSSLIGGGNPPRLGEVTLAHGGVLFLDELPEFRPEAIESLRTVLEEGRVQVSRTHYRLELPARMLVAAAMNPCPCGFDGDRERLCTCPPERVRRYRSRVSGPLLDRFDLHVQLPRLPGRLLRRAPPGEPSALVRQRVIAARRYRADRLACSPIQQAQQRESLDWLHANAEREALQLLDQAAEQLGVSGRGYAKILRVARTIADLAASATIAIAHVAEAVQYRIVDREAAQPLPASPASKPTSG